MSGRTEREVSAATEFTSRIVAAYVSRNHVQASEMPGLIERVHGAVAALASNEGPEVKVDATPKPSPAQIRKSVHPDYIVSFEDGKSYKTLGRHLRTRNLTPEAYREKHGLPSDYPMTAKNYSELRASLARESGLGQRRGPKQVPTRNAA